MLRSIFVCIICISCARISEEGIVKQFEILPPQSSGIDFSNDLKYLKEFNIYTYRNFYNGGGVAVGDVNNDGFVDIYFTGNMVPNKLYLNNGDLTFTDVTEIAGVGGKGGWCTGVSMADVNGDGWLDIYVCNSGRLDGDDKKNELFINNGDGTFTEMAAQYGLADPGYSTHAAFFDYDMDGDLDMYLLNNSFQAIGSFNLRKNERPKRDSFGGDKLFRNDGSKFTDVSEEAGIYGSIIGFGLGVTVGDINNDGWLDIFVSNDFFERDYIYINNGDGSFSEVLEQYMRSISGASMGADMADLNNDGLPDIFVTEMLPEPNDRLKTKTTFENWNRYQYGVANDYYHQFTRNMLQLNNGDGTFSEIGRLAGVEATDWSWGALIADFDNDGQKDLFVANGIFRDLTDQDYINYVSTEEVVKSMVGNEGVDYLKLIDAIPSNKVSNYMYQNLGGFNFRNVAKAWGLDLPSHSNGSAYADLDNDGDLDLIVNNLNQVASVYINKSEKINPEHKYLKIELTGTPGNQQAVGTKITVWANGIQHFIEQVPVKGFQSSVDPRPNFGLGNIEKIDSIVVNWMTGKTESFYDVPFNSVFNISLSDHQRYLKKSGGIEVVDDILFKTADHKFQPDFRHIENEYDHFDKERLIYHMMSAEGPAFCKGDFNGDGREDFYIGGARNQSGGLYLRQNDGTWKRVFDGELATEDVTCACFDADGDGDLDLYIGSGSAEFSSNSTELIDRLYFNDGKGNLTKSDQLLPSFKFENTSTVKYADFDGDGDFDLFVGVRSRPQLIGIAPDSYLLINDGKGNFTDETDKLAPGLRNLGMVTDAIWEDLNGDGYPELIVVGEYMPITIFNNESGKLVSRTSDSDLAYSNGWWNTIISADIDGDGDSDFILGNHGLNSRFKASRERPISMYVKDFDGNGSMDPIICTFYKDTSYPLALRHDLITQLPHLKKKFNLYEDYKHATINDLFSKDELKNARILNAYQLASSILINEGNGQFRLQSLPVEAQFSPVYAILFEDLDKDGIPDLLLGGNFYYAKPEVGRYDASYGTFLKGDGQGGFNWVPNRKIGLKLEGQIKGMLTIEQLLLVAGNNTVLSVYEIQ
jgi:enediyne biosynthesis protein E4